MLTAASPSCAFIQQPLMPASGLIIDLRRPRAASSATAMAGRQEQHTLSLIASSALTWWPPTLRPLPPLAAQVSPVRRVPGQGAGQAGARCGCAGDLRHIQPATK